jgi:HEAT repeat protein
MRSLPTLIVSALALFLVPLAVCFAQVPSVQAPSAADLAAKLKSATAAEQHAAADALADLGPKAAAALPQLVAALESKDAELRWRSARALGVIDDPRAAAALRKHVADADAAVRAQAIFSLGRLEVKDNATVQAIAARLTDEDANVRRACVRALQMIKPDRAVMTPLVVKVLEDSDPAVIMPALHTIAEAGAEVVPALTAALGHKEARYWACLVLSEIGPAAKDAVPELTKVLADERPEVRLQAAIALGEIGPAAKVAVPALVKALDDQFEGVRHGAVFSLGRIGDPSASEAVASLEKSDNPFQDTLTLWTLARLNPGDKERMKAAVEQLVGNLGGDNRDVAHMSARAIVELDPDPAILRPAMEAAMAKADAATGERIILAYASLGPKVVPLAIKALKDKDAKRRERALHVLGHLGPDAAPAVPDLVALLKSGDAKEKVETLFVLAAIGPKAAPAVEPVAGALAESDQNVKLTAGYCLGKIGPGAKAASPALEKLLASDDKMAKLTGVWALLQIAPGDAALGKKAVPMLADALTHEREFVRIEAAMALGKLGKTAASALPALEAAKGDASEAVRDAAEAAIKQIKG